MNADAKLLAGIPERMPERIAEVLEPFDGDAGVGQHVDAAMSGVYGAFDLRDNGFDCTHERNRRERDEAVAHPAKLGERVVVCFHTSELKLRITIKESSSRAVGEKNFRVDT